MSVFFRLKRDANATSYGIDSALLPEGFNGFRGLYLHNERARSFLGKSYIYMI